MEGSDFVTLPRREGYLRRWEAAGDNRSRVGGHFPLVLYKKLCAGTLLDAGAGTVVLNSGCPLESPG